MKFWAQTDENGKIISALSRIDGDVTVSSYCENAEEIFEFLNVVGFRTIQCEKRLVEQVGAEASIEGYVVEYVKNNNEIAKIQADKEFRPKEIYGIIKMKISVRKE